MSGFTDLAEDILIRIVSFLSPPDIICLRQVAKTLYSVTYQPVVWIRAYKSAALPRPPGPNLRPGDKEGLKLLERALVQSAKLEPWSSTRNFHPDAVHTSPRVGDSDHVDQWHFPQSGSWFITTIESSVVYRNLNSDDPQTHVLFRLDDSSRGIDLFQCADTVTLAGHPITYVLLVPRESACPSTLLKIVGHFRSSLSLESAIPLPFPGYRVSGRMTAGPRYVYVHGFALLDVTTEKIYYLPAFKSSMAPDILERLARDNNHSRHADFLLTDTHILAVFFSQGADRHIQAFGLPSLVGCDATGEDEGMLRMTHEGICKSIVSPHSVLRGNTVTNVGGVQTTEIRVMNNCYMHDGASAEDEYTAIDLVLTASSSPGIGTITVSQCTPLIFLKDEEANPFKIGSSDDGFGRGVCNILRGYGEEYLGLQMFAVDASGPVCRVDVGPRRDVSMLYELKCDMQFDVWSGKVCYVLDDIIKVHQIV